jgi:hypothetical protein
MNKQMKKFEPYVFKDEDPRSETFNLWSIRIEDSCSLDGYPTRESALADLYIKETNRAIREDEV